MNNKNSRKFVLSALFAAIIFVTTLLLPIPAPLLGNMNLGDCFVLLSGIVLGPAFGAVAAGVGSALADLVGYAIYAPATLIIKALMAFLIGFLYKKIQPKKIYYIPLFGLLSELIMICGYYLYEVILLGSFIAPLVNIPFNLAQALLGIISSTLIFGIIKKSNIFK